MTSSKVFDILRAMKIINLRQIIEAIADERLLGTINQDPFQLGCVATQELLMLLQQQPTETPFTPKELLVPVKKITRENLPSDI